MSQKSDKSDINNETPEPTTSRNRIGMRETREEIHKAERVTKVAGIMGYNKFGKIASV